MEVRTVRVGDPVGLHLRAASRIVQLAKRFPCAIHISYNGARANARSILGIAALIAGPRVEVQISADGEQAAEAVHAMAELIETELAVDSTS